MPCDLNSLAATTQPWNRLDPKVILAIQIGLMCDALNGIDPTSELNPIALAERLNCFSALSQNQLMGIWTVLWAQFLELITATGASIFLQGVPYTGTDPTSDGVKPVNLNGQALAIKPGSTTFTWDVVNHVWT